MKKRILLFTLLSSFGFILLGCLSESENEQADSATAVSTESVSSSQTSEVSSDESMEESSATTKTETTNTTSDSTSSEEDKKEEGQEKDIPIREYSDEEKEEVSQEFLDWAISRAEEGNMAVTDNYFDHGASGPGDWFVVTEDGEMQVQQQSTEEELPGYDAYDIHSLGGVVFYVSSSEVTGYDEKPKNMSGAHGQTYSKVADPGYSLHKYLLADNGVVYELIGNVDEIGSTSAGFGLYGEDGKAVDIDPEFTFKVSEDEDAQEEWRQILQDYQ